MTGASPQHPGKSGETLQNFINKHTVDLENVQRNKKKEKGEALGCQVSSSKVVFSFLAL
jgi:hypothetical protein